MKIAVIDLGSNAVRMTLAEVEGKVNIVKQYRENVRLSEGMSVDNMLKEQPALRTVEALQKFVKIASGFGAEKTVAVATAAMRKAKNKEVIVNPLNEMGISLEIIDGIKEAYYDFVGIINKTELSDFLIVDLGGASTELILVKDRKYKGVVSLPFGAVTLTEKYNNPKNYVTGIFNSVVFLNEARGLPIIALGGTARSFGQIDVNTNDIAETHIISFDRLKEIYEKISAMTAEEIRETTPVEPKRADIIGAGLTAVFCLAEMIETKEIIVDKSGVMEGILYDLAN